MIKEQLEEVEERICRACRRAGRKREEVTLIAVSKTHPVSVIEEAYGEGIRIFGENKVQELCQKEAVLPKDIQWHLIGHLQRNKVKQVIQKAALIHSVDSLRLAEVIEAEAAKKNLVSDVLLEINMAREKSKYGLMPEEAVDFAVQMEAFPHICVKGLMTIAPFVENAEENRIHFSNLRKLAVDIEGKKVNNVNVSILSMGMTNDYEIAIEEGATMVRVGTGIFGKRDYDIT